MKPFVLKNIVERDSPNRPIQEYLYDYNQSLNTILIDDKWIPVVKIAKDIPETDTLTKAQGEQDDLGMSVYEKEVRTFVKGERSRVSLTELYPETQTRAKGENDKISYLSMEMTTKTLVSREEDDEHFDYIQ